MSPELILREGCRTGAEGRVVAVGGSVTFEPPLPVPLAGYLPGRQPVQPASPLGVRVDDADLDLLARSRERDGAVEGWAKLSGMWLGDRLQVEAQQPKDPIDFDNHRTMPDWSHPPCSPPRDGWPHGPTDENLDVGEFRDLRGHWPVDGPIVALTLFRPSPTQVVAVVAAHDPDQVEMLLRPRLAARLCVVPSKWTRAQIDTTRNAALTRFDTLIYRVGETADVDGQALVDAAAVRVDQALHDWIVTIPATLLRLDVWLRPDRPGV